MKLLVAIRDYINKNGGPQVTVVELKAFSAAITPEDRAEYQAELESYGYEIVT